MYKIEILQQADKDIRTYQKAGNKAAIQRIQEILQELSIHPATGIGKPEELKHELSGYWSRRIDKSNPYLHIRKHLPDNYLLVEFVKPISD